MILIVTGEAAPSYSGAVIHSRPRIPPVSVLAYPPRIRRSAHAMVVDWTLDPHPSGTVFQVYLNKRLAWSGTARLATFAYPRERIRVDVLSVDAGGAGTDYSGLIPDATQPADKATLSWIGGTTLSATLAGFRIYQGDVAGGAVDYTTPVGYVPATVSGISLDGYGMGGYGSGGYGHAGLPYTWQSAPLATGTWNFAVAPVDAAGNQAGTPATTSVVIAGPPNPPAAFSDGTRLRYTYNAGTRVPTLTWNASPP